MKLIARLRPAAVLPLLALLALPMAVHAKAGQVLFIYGTAHVESQSGERAALAKGSDVESGDRITTGSNGRLQIRMSDGGLLALRPQSEFVIEEYNYPRLSEGGTVAAGEKPSRSFFTLVKGGFRSITGAIGKSDKAAYRVRTPVATIGIRGTDYTAVLCSGCADAEDGLYLGVAEGGVRLSNKGGSLDVNAGQFGFVASEDSAPAQSRAAARILAGMPAGQSEESDDREGEGTDPSPEVAATAMDDAGNSVVFTEGETSSSDASGAVTYSGAMGNSAVSAAGKAAQTNDSTNNLTGFTGSDSARYEVGSDQVVNVGRDEGRDEATGLRWGRWSGGDMQVDVAGGASSESLEQESVHWVADSNPRPELPTTGSANFELVGNTSPTDNQGNVGTLGSASLSADFSAQTVDADVSLAFEETNQVWDAHAEDVDINAADATFDGAFDTVSVTDTGDQSSTDGAGDLSGFFSGDAAGNVSGAGMSYSLSDGEDTAVSGAAVFQSAED